MKPIYLLLAVLGTVIPFVPFVQWLSEHGVNISLFFQHIIGNKLGLFAWLDVVIAALALILFILVDSRKHNIQSAWLAILATLSIGVSCGLPLYLFLRESRAV